MAIMKTVYGLRGRLNRLGRADRGATVRLFLTPLAMVGALALTGCAAGSDPSPGLATTPTVDSTAPPNAGSAATSPSVPPSVTDEVGLPPAEPGRTTLLAAGPQSGAAIAGRVTTGPGALWISLDCQGDGSLVLAVGSASTSTIPCGPDLHHVLNKIDAAATAQPLGVTVETSAEVRWALRIEQ